MVDVDVECDDVTGFDSPVERAQRVNDSRPTTTRATHMPKPWK